eukprot:8788087-Ditylum_brightwellii.AAC.1
MIQVLYPSLQLNLGKHVDEFVGKQCTKAMKRQLDGNMLWRRLMKEKEMGGTRKKMMSADERVEVLIQDGLL